MADPELSFKIRRWDDIRRNQFSIALTTFIALATGGIGYCAKLVSDEKVHFSCWASFWFLIASAAFGFGLLVGVFTTWTRLWDSRLTAHKHHRKNEGASNDELNRITAKFEFWGTVTWFLFHTLVICVSLGIVSITCCVTVIYHAKLLSDQPEKYSTNGVQVLTNYTPASHTNAAIAP